MLGMNVITVCNMAFGISNMNSKVVKRAFYSATFLCRREWEGKV